MDTLSIEGHAVVESLTCIIPSTHSLIETELRIDLGNVSVGNPDNL